MIGGSATLRKASPGRAEQNTTGQFAKGDQKMKSIKVAELVLDYDFYPRPGTDPSYVTELTEALRSGVELPSILYDTKTKKVVDGFHRVKAKKRLDGDNAEIMAIGKTYRTEADLFKDVMEYNSTHGKRLTPFDRTRCMIIGDRLKMSTETIASALHVTKNRLVGLETTKIGKGNSGLRVALKESIKHMAGKKLTKEQIEANNQLSGMRQIFYVNQLITLIENDLLDKSDDKLMKRLKHLKRLI